MPTPQQIQNTVVFLSRVPTQGVAEAEELVRLVKFYQSLLPTEPPVATETVPESDTENEPNTTE